MLCSNSTIVIGKVIYGLDISTTGHPEMFPADPIEEISIIMHLSIVFIETRRNLMNLF